MLQSISSMNEATLDNTGNQAQAPELTRNQFAAVTAPNLPATVPKLAYTMRETAQALGLSYPTIQRLVARGMIRASTALRHKVIPITEIERFLKATVN